MITASIHDAFAKVKVQAQKDHAQAELLITGSEVFSATYQKGGLEKFNSTGSTVAGFRVLVGPSAGYAFTENLNEDSLLRCYKEAYENALFLRTDKKQEALELVEPAPVTEMKFLFNPELEDHTIEEKLEMAKQLEVRAMEADSRVENVPYSGFSHSRYWTKILNTKGVDVTVRANSISGYTYALAKQGEQKKMGGDGQWSRKWEAFDPISIAKRGVQKATQLLGAKSLVSGKYNVIFDCEVASQLFSLLAGQFSAKDVYNRKSILGEKLETKILSDKIHIKDDPFLENGISSRPFDSEGSPSQQTDLVSYGVLKSYLTNSEYAKKMHLKNTANASRGASSELDISPSNFVVAKGKMLYQDMLQKFDKVVVITSLAGLHSGVNHATGDFSLQADGLLYENGNLVHPVEQIVVSGNILSTFQNISELSNRYPHGTSNVLVPDILVENVAIAGKG